MTPAEIAVFVEKTLRDAGAECSVTRLESAIIVSRTLSDVPERPPVRVTVEVVAVHPQMNVAQVCEVKS
jgi:hypothetical protein